MTENEQTAGQAAEITCGALELISGKTYGGGSLGLLGALVTVVCAHPEVETIVEAKKKLHELMEYGETCLVANFLSYTRERGLLKVLPVEQARGN